MDLKGFDDTSKTHTHTQHLCNKNVCVCYIYTHIYLHLIPSSTMYACCGCIFAPINPIDYNQIDRQVRWLSLLLFRVVPFSSYISHKLAYGICDHPV